MRVHKGKLFKALDISYHETRLILSRVRVP